MPRVELICLTLGFGGVGRHSRSDSPHPRTAGVGRRPRRAEVSGVTLPIGLAMFRATQPAMNVAIALYLAYWFAVPIQPANLAAAVAVGALV